MCSDVFIMNIEFFYRIQVLSKIIPTSLLEPSVRVDDLCNYIDY